MLSTRAAEDAAQRRLSAGSARFSRSLPQRAVDPALDGALALAQHAGDVAQLQVGAEAQGERLALVLVERRQRSVELVAVLDRVQAGVEVLRACRPR